MAKKMSEVVAEALATAEYCSTCEKDFIDESDKVGPDEQTIFWTGNADVICQNCQDIAVDNYLDSYNS